MVVGIVSCITTAYKDSIINISSNDSSKEDSKFASEIFFWNGKDFSWVSNPFLFIIGIVLWGTGIIFGLCFYCCFECLCKRSLNSKSQDLTDSMNAKRMYKLLRSKIVKNVKSFCDSFRNWSELSMVFRLQWKLC